MNAERVVDFYYSIGSRYSYLASTQIAKLERETGSRVRWHPVNGPDIGGCVAVIPLPANRSPGSTSGPIAATTRSAGLTTTGSRFASHELTLRFPVAREGGDGCEATRRCGSVQSRAVPGRVGRGRLAA